MSRLTSILISHTPTPLGRAEGAEAASAWAECQQQLLLLACRPHPALLHIVAEVWTGVMGCARAPRHSPACMLCSLMQGVLPIAALLFSVS